MTASQLTVRRMDFELDFGQPGSYWNASDAFKTHMFNAGSVLFEVGERFFIDVLREHGAHVPSEALRDNIDGFIGQEANHRRVHLLYNEQLAERGYAVDRLRARPFRTLSWFRRYTSPKTQLAMVAACEHLTSVLSVCTLSEESWLQGAHPAFRDLWRWHCAEEIEHKNVVFDVYRGLGGGYLRRALAMLLASALFFGALNRNLVHMLWHDRKLWSWQTFATAASVMFRRPGAFWQFFPRWLAYFAPGFHPDNESHLHLIRPWLDELVPSVSIPARAKRHERKEG